MLENPDKVLLLLTLNPLVEGSNPSRPTMYYKASGSLEAIRFPTPVARSYPANKSSSRDAATAN